MPLPAHYRWLVFAAFYGTFAAVACAVDTPLYERRPTDLVVLNATGDSAQLEVLPLEDRNPKTVAPRSGDLIARLTEAPSEEVAIPSATIDRVELFEQRLLSEAKRHAAAKEFGKAYDFFARLDRDYPDLPGFSEAFNKAVYDEARAKFGAKQYDHALALLQSLHERAPGMAGLTRAVDVIGDSVLQDKWDAGDYVGVRRVIDAIESQFAGLRLTLEKKWLGMIEEGAQRERDKAERLAAAGHSREALRVLSGAVALDPNSTATNRLVQKLSTADRTLWVGVWEAADAAAVVELDTPAARRQGRLVGGQLASLDAYLPAGGEYATSVGELDAEDGRRRLSIRFRDQSDAPYRLARALLEPVGGSREPLALLRKRAVTVSIGDPGVIEIELRGAHPQPQALACDTLPAGLAEIAPGNWRRVSPAAGSEAATRYERVSGSGGFDAIEEFVYQDIDEAIAALRSRQVHVLDSIPPWRLSGLEATPGVSLTSLRLPTLHCLLMHPETPLRHRREVRRALCYAIAREETLTKLVLGGESRTGFELLSTAAPRGKSLSDPLRYAYNESIEPRPYEPRLAALLLTAARAEDVAEDKTEGEATETKRSAAGRATDVPASITLAHPPTPVARLAAEAIAEQLGAIGLGVELREASEADLSAGRVAYDLRYAEITVGEPLVDVWRLLGPGGVAGGCSPPMRDGLERVVTATTGKAAAAALRDLHRIAFADLPLIPLWQTIEYVAYQKSLNGVAEDSIGLYQSVDRWRVTGEVSR